ncbi:MAG: DUF116 domain-containing protein [Planctomycetes bacterium]|jgi:hypothetical protein|nr:DUF116 domain-containing protein [Planctomycetota bacterium]
MADEIPNPEPERAPDRKLGDEWEDWSGDPGECEAVLREGKGKFVLFAFVLLVLTAGALFGLLYMVYPRLESFDPRVGLAAAVAVCAGVATAGLWFLLFWLSLLLERNLLPASGRVGLAIAFFAPRVIWLGQRFGISRDRMGSSFVKVCNCLIKVARIAQGKGDVLVLLPRCLSKEVRPKILEVCERYGCRVETVAGGEAARAAVKRIRPRGIVAVACERDLVTGLRDVVAAFPAVGVANRREEGPCKNTTVDLAEFEETLRIFFANAPADPATAK